MNTYVVVTSIHNPTSEIYIYSDIYKTKILWVGDEKNELFTGDKNNFIFLSLKKQLQEWGKAKGMRLAEQLPKNHYSRKNMGYLKALSLEKQGSNLLDTDDDNFPILPYRNFPPFAGKYTLISCQRQVSRYNVYSEFTENNVWPRGLGYQFSAPTTVSHDTRLCSVGVWQGLADIDPDVDAIYRLANLGPVYFANRDPVVLDKFCYCPINSQNTFWDTDYIEYAYLPSTVSFRFTDILRGYVAQRCLWEHDQLVGFISPNVKQIRNEHDLISDLRSEIEMYACLDRLIETLSSISLSKDKSKNLVSIYSSLAKEEIVSQRELSILSAWLHDVEFIRKNVHQKE